MQILEPIVHETVWGGSTLTKYSCSDCQKIGHLYSAIDTPEFRNHIIYGTYEGKTLHDWFIDNRSKYGMNTFDELPILMALIDASDDLSIQVHPNDDVARYLENLPFGKNESFYTLKAPTSGKMYNGCKANSIEEVITAINENKTMDIVDSMDCEEGDYVYIESGTLHAATAGSIHFEIEENCEKTYRFYDYDRKDVNGNKRQLHLFEAIASLDVNKKSKARKYNGFAPIVERMYFSRLIKNRDIYEHNDSMFAFVVMLDGNKTINNVNILPGTAILLGKHDIIDTSGATFMLVEPIVRG